jgi:hypothetical protein
MTPGWRPSLARIVRGPQGRPVGVPAIRKPVVQAWHEQQTECQRYGDPGRPDRRQMSVLAQEQVMRASAFGPDLP